MEECNSNAVNKNDEGGEVLLLLCVLGSAIAILVTLWVLRLFLRRMIRCRPRVWFGENKKKMFLNHWSGAIDVAFGAIYITAFQALGWKQRFSIWMSISLSDTNWRFFSVFVLAMHSVSVIILVQPRFIRWILSYIWGETRQQELSNEDTTNIDLVVDFVRLLRPDLIVNGKGGYDEPLDMTPIGIHIDNIDADLLDVQHATRFAVYMDVDCTDHVINILVLPKTALFPFFNVTKQSAAKMKNICFERLADHTNERLKVILGSLKKQKRSHVTLGLPGLGKSAENNICLSELILNMGNTHAEPSPHDAALLSTVLINEYERESYMWPKVIFLRLDETFVKIRYSSRLSDGTISIQGQHLRSLELVEEAMKYQYSEHEPSVAIIEFKESEKDLDSFQCKMACVFSQSPREFSMAELSKAHALVRHVAVPLTRPEVSVVGQVCKTDFTSNLTRADIEANAEKFGGVLRNILMNPSQARGPENERASINTSIDFGDLTMHNVPSTLKHFVTPYPLYGTKAFDPVPDIVFAFLSPAVKQSFVGLRPPERILKQLYGSSSAENEYKVGELLSRRKRSVTCKVYPNIKGVVKKNSSEPVDVPGLILQGGRAHGISFSSLPPAAAMRDDYIYVPVSEQQPLFDCAVYSSTEKMVFLVQASVKAPINHAFKIAQLERIKEQLELGEDTGLVYIYATLEIGRKHGLKFSDADENLFFVADHMEFLGLSGAYILEYWDIERGPRSIVATDQELIKDIEVLYG